MLLEARHTVEGRGLKGPCERNILLFIDFQAPDPSLTPVKSLKQFELNVEAHTQRIQLVGELLVCGAMEYELVEKGAFNSRCDENIALIEEVRVGENAHA